MPHSNVICNRVTIATWEHLGKILKISSYPTWLGLQRKYKDVEIERFHSGLCEGL